MDLVKRQLWECVHLSPKSWAGRNQNRYKNQINLALGLKRRRNLGVSEAWIMSKPRALFFLRAKFYPLLTWVQEGPTLLGPRYFNQHWPLTQEQAPCHACTVDTDKDIRATNNPHLLHEIQALKHCHISSVESHLYCGLMKFIHIQNHSVFALQQCHCWSPRTFHVVQLQICYDVFSQLIWENNITLRSQLSVVRNHNATEEEKENRGWFCLFCFTALFTSSALAHFFPGGEPNTAVL